MAPPVQFKDITHVQRGLILVVVPGIRTQDGMFYPRRHRLPRAGPTNPRSQAAGGDQQNESDREQDR